MYIYVYIYDFPFFHSMTFNPFVLIERIITNPGTIGRQASSLASHQ